MASRILFVDDDVSIHFAVAEYFGERGDVVDCAQSAPQALARLAAGRYDVVVADLRLSGAGPMRSEPEGLAFIERLRRDHPDLPVLVLTACGEDLAREALRRGADRYLQKPQPLSQMAAVVKVLCGGSR